MFGAKTKGRFSHEEEREYRDGEVVFNEGDRSRELFVVQRGEVVISKRSGQSELTLGVISRGSIFGEMALLESLPRSASARARGDARLLVIQPGGFLMKIRRDPTFAFELMQQLSGRIRRTNERLAAAVEQRKAAKVAREIIAEAD